MKKDVIQKIDLLIEMSDTNNQYDTLKEEFNIVELDISKNKKMIQELTDAMADSKYIKASDRLIDENIKISLENKLQSYQESLKQLDKKIQDVSLEEEEYHQNILVIEKEISASKKFLDSLELKLKTIGAKDKSIYTFYEDLIDTTEKDITKNEKLLKDKREEFSCIQEHLESYAISRVSLEEKIRKASLQLDEVKESLNNSSSYVDLKMKRDDEAKIEELQLALEGLEKRRLEIINDPSFIGHEATELLLDEDNTSTMAKVRELVSLVKTHPYMDLASSEVEDVLAEAMQKRDDFASAIEVRQYDGIDSTVIDGRISFLKSCLDKLVEEKNSLEKRIREFDTVSVKELMKWITDAKLVRDRLKEDIDEYKAVMNENIDYKTPKKKASLSSAFHRKCDELEQVNRIVEAYEHDLEEIIMKSKVLEEQNLEQVHAEISKIETEIKGLEKKRILQNSPVDILAIEKDKSTLKMLSDDVEKILHRKKYDKTPDEILDEIEIALSSYSDDEELVIEEDEAVPNDYRIDDEVDFSDQEGDSISLEEEPQESLIDEDESVLSIPEEESAKEDETPIDKIEDEIKIDSNEVLEEEEKEEHPNRLKVVRVTPIEEDSFENNFVREEDEYMVNDFEDTDYISFNDLIEGGKSHEDQGE